MYALLANPSSGAGRGAHVRQKVISHLTQRNISFREISGTSYESALINLRSHLSASKPKALIVVGGDGMVHLAIQELANTDIPLLLVPGGTGNDFARSLSLKLEDPEDVLDFALLSQPQRVDLGKVNGRYFAEILSTGFDSKVNERANRMKIQSKVKYDLAMLRELPVFQPLDYEIEIDNQKLSTKAMLIAIANGKSYGGGMLISPFSKLDDSLLDLFILEPVSKFEFLKVFPKVFKGSHVDHPKVKFLSGKKIRISAAAVAYADGERIGDLPIEASIEPQALLTWTRR